MLISRPSNSGLKRLINIQKCCSSTKLDHCALLAFEAMSPFHKFVRPLYMETKRKGNNLCLARENENKWHG